MAEIVPAILTNDISDFRKKYAELFALSHYFTKLHIDFIDGKFLPNKTVMPKDLALESSPFELMAHFMTLHPQIYFFHAKKAGFKWVIFHWEAFEDKNEILDVLDHAEHLGLKTGLAFNPETKFYDAAKYLDKVNLLQVMGVHPGAQGRPFEKNTIDRIKELKSLTKNVIISVDGGEKVGIAKQCAHAGANHIIAGSAILNSGHPKQALEELNQDIKT